MAAFSRHQLHRSAFRHAGEMEGCATPCEGSASTAARGNGAGRTLRNRGGMKDRGRRCRSRFRSDATKIVAVRTLYRARKAILLDRKNVVQGKRVSVRVDTGGTRLITKQKHNNNRED